MKAQIIHSFGGSSVFQLEEVSKPKLLPGHVLIDVKATSVNPIDTKCVVVPFQQSLLSFQLYYTAM